MSGPRDGGTRAAPASPGGRLRAWAELLRAPLLLSPLADVAAGFAFAAGSAVLTGTDGRQSRGLPADTWFAPLALAAAVGTCLLAAGMLQNALLDLSDDRARKPQRPLPRGTVTLRDAWIAWGLLTIAGLALAQRAGPSVLRTAAAIVVLTAAYHLLLKRRHLPGCLALGTLRALDLWLGVAAVQGLRGGPGTDAAGILHVRLDGAVELAWVAGIYGLYITGASLHASTDDEPGGGGWSRFGLSVAAAVFVLLGGLAAVLIRERPTPALLALAVAGYGLWRLARARRRLPPPALTGVGRSGLYLVDASLCLMSSGRSDLPTWILGLGVLVLFAASRAAFKVFPPS